MRNIVITGGAGFIASHVVDIFLSFRPQNTEIVVIDSFEYCATKKNLNKAVKYVENVDITDLSAIRETFEKHGIDTVIHLAAQSHVDNSFGNSLPFTEVNVKGTHVLLEVFRERWERSGKPSDWRFVHISTDEVYGSTDEKHHEESLLQPTNPYAASKAAAEMLVQSYFRSFKMPVVITRSNNVYGPRQYPEKVMPKFILRLLAGQMPRLQGSGLQKRSFLYATDVAEAILKVYEKGQVGRIYNIGGRDELSIVDLASRLTNMIKKDCTVEEQKFVNDVDRPFNDHRYDLDTSRLVEELKWEQKVPFEEGLQKTIDWYASIDPKTYWDELPHDLYDKQEEGNKDKDESMTSSCSSSSSPFQSNIAICIHLWDKTQLGEMLSYTSSVAAYCRTPVGANARVECILITVAEKKTSEKEVQQIEQQFIQATGCKHVKVMPVQNRGFDIGGFLVQCGYILDHKLRIDFVLKLHTKSPATMRTRMINPLCKSHVEAGKCIRMMQNDASVGQLGAAYFVMADRPLLAVRNENHLNDLFKLLCPKKENIPNLKIAQFVAGTLFWYRWSLLQTLFQQHASPCLLRKLLNDESSLDYHWYRLQSRPAGIQRFASDCGELMISGDNSVRHFESVGNAKQVPGSIIHSNFDAKGTPWDLRMRDGQIEHAFERFFGYWVAYNGFKVSRV